MLIKPRCPCMMKCNIRTKNCHIKCERYLEYEKELHYYYENKDAELTKEPPTGVGLDGYPLHVGCKNVDDSR